MAKVKSKNALISAIAAQYTVKQIVQDNGATIIGNVTSIAPDLESECQDFVAELLEAAKIEIERTEKAETLKAQILELQAELKQYKPKSRQRGLSPSRPVEERSDWGIVEIDGETFSSLSKGCKTLRNHNYNSSALSNFKWLIANGSSVTFLRTGRTVETEADYQELLAG